MNKICSVKNLFLILDNMACEMTGTSFDKIRKDYETSLVLLQKHRYEAEKQEKVRLDKIKEYRIQQMIIMEKQKDADPGNELPTTSKPKESSTETEESDDPSSEEDEPMPITPITKTVKKTVLSPSARASDENNKTEKKDNGKQKKRKMDQNIPLTPKIANPVSKVAYGDISDGPSSEEDEPMSTTPITKMVKKTVLSPSAGASDENNKTEKKDNGKQKKRKMDQNIPLTPKIANPVSKVAHGDIISVILKRLDSIEKRLNDPVIIDEPAEANNSTSSSVNTVPSIPLQRTTFGALKLSWIPQLFTKLNAIHADIVSNHTNE